MALPPWPPAHAVVSGGSSGIGLACARALARQGARVSLIARRPGPLAEAAEALGALALPADLSDPRAARAAAEAAEAAQGPCDLLIAAAGAVAPARIEDAAPDAFEAAYAANVATALNLARPLLPGMRARGAGRVVLIGSAAGLMGLPGLSAYSAAKFALRGAAEALRAECAPDGVRVSIAYPPDVDTPQLAAERPLRAPETAALAGTAGTMSAAAAAAAILRGARSGRFDVPLGLTAWAMLRLMP
ncbi:MAG: SDR family NAD(P)-dependent oxidoreductase, partial [Pseudomonadota bacterium]